MLKKMKGWISPRVWLLRITWRVPDELKPARQHRQPLPVGHCPWTLLAGHCQHPTARTPQPSGTRRHRSARGRWSHHFGTPVAGFTLPPRTQQVLWCPATYADSGQVYFCIWQIMFLYQGSDYLPWWTSVIYSSFWSRWFKKKKSLMQ